MLYISLLDSLCIEIMCNNEGIFVVDLIWIHFGYLCKVFRVDLYYMVVFCENPNFYYTVLKLLYLYTFKFYILFIQLILNRLIAFVKLT